MSTSSTRDELNLVPLDVLGVNDCEEGEKRVSVRRKKGAKREGKITFELLVEGDGWILVDETTQRVEDQTLRLIDDVFGSHGLMIEKSLGERERRRRMVFEERREGGREEVKSRFGSSEERAAFPKGEKEHRDSGPLGTSRKDGPQLSLNDDRRAGPEQNSL